MSSISQSQLVTINLKFGSHAKPLRLLAFADLASNALFSLDREATEEEVTAEMSRLLALPGIEKALIKDALALLRTDGKAQQKAGRWKLTAETGKAIAIESENSDNALRGVLSRHFPGGIEPTILKAWFLQASSDFFGFNGAEWVKSISRNTNVHFARPQTIRDLLKSSLSKYKLQAREDDLVESYDAFLTSDNPADVQYVMNLGFAMFSAQLVAAGIGADPITIDEIRGATFVLDTNALLPIQLDAHRLANSIRALGLALTDIDAELVYLDTTAQEYRRVHVGKRGEILTLFREYPADVVLGAESDFIETGVSRGCKTGDDFEVFFDSIQKPPSELPSGLKITKMDDSQIDADCKKGEGDRHLKAAIQKHCLRQRAKWDKRPKSEAALNHDAALIRVTEELRREKNKTWILSLDRGLWACAAERAGAHGVPVVFMLDGLIQILAVHSGGPNRNATDFAPLLTSILLNRCSPSERTYTPQDLSWLYAIQQRVADFSPEDIKKVVAIVTQHRFAGAMADDPKLQLAINRAYQEKKREYSQEVAEAHERARGAEAEAESTKQKLDDTQKELGRLKYAYCIRLQWQKLRRALYWRVPAALAAAAGMYVLAVWSWPTTQKEILGWVASVLTFAGLFGWLLVQPVKAFRAGCAKCNDLKE